jgi:transitional endoplasmic reticulum ATPase
MSKKDLKNFEDALKNAPNNIALRLTYALKLFKLKEFDLSEKNYQAVLKLDPNNKKAKQGLVELYFAKENYSAVIIIAEELVKINSASEKMMELYAKALLRQNSISDAQEVYDKIIKNNPFYFDEELDSVLEDDNEYLNDQLGSDDDEFDDEDMDDFFNNPFLDDETHLFLPDSGLTWKKVFGLSDLKNFIDYKSGNLDLDPENRVEEKIGLLLYGPPGCGKTFFVRSLTSKTEAEILPLGIDRLLDIYSYKPEGLLHYYFGKMRINSPCILYIDEVDKYAQDRSNLTSHDERLTVSKLLEELDNVRFQDQFVVASTNRPWEIDPVFFTPGKFNHQYFVGPPNFEERSEFLTSKFQGKKKYTELNTMIEVLAAKTRNFSYAEINQAFEQFRFKIGEVKTKKQNIDFNILLNCIEDINPYAPIWFEQFLSSWPEKLKSLSVYQKVAKYTNQIT